MLQQDPQSFPTEGVQRPILHTCAFFYVSVQDMEVLFVLFGGSADPSDLVYVAVRAGVCVCAAATDYNQDLKGDILS